MKPLSFYKPSHGPPGAEKLFLEQWFESLRRDKGIEAAYRIPAWENWQADLQAWSDRAGGHVIYSPGTWLPELSGKGLLRNLAEAVPDDVKRWEALYPPELYALGRVDGRQVGIPVYGAVWCFMYNARLLELAKAAAPPATWEELLLCASRVKAAFSDVIPYGINDDSDGHFADHGFVYLIAGGRSRWASGSGPALFDHEWAVNGLRLLQDLVRRGLANKPIHSPSRRIKELFFEEKIAMTVGPSDWILEQRLRYPELPLRVAMMPCPQGGEPLSYASCGFYSIIAEDGAVRDAAALLEQLIEPRHLERHIATVGMLPLQTGMRLYSGDAEMSMFARQVALSGSLPAAGASVIAALIREVLACLNLEQSPEEALQAATLLQ